MSLRDEIRDRHPAGLIYRTQEETPANTPDEPDPWTGWNAWMRGHLHIERQSMREEVAKAVVDLVIELRKDWHEEIRKAISERDTKITRLEAQLETLTRMLAAAPGRSLFFPDGT